jgi:cobalt transporter subunit CbtB
MLSGVAAKETNMNTQAKVAVQTQTKTSTNMMVIAFAAFVGLGMITIAGHLQAAALHDAAHDVRHATGFPCH